MENLGAYFLTFQPKLLAIYINNVYICSILTLIYTTMAIVTNFWLKGSKKRLGGAVLYKAMGQTRARELANSVTNPRTEAQMSQRIKWSNLVNFYRANASWMKYAFETKKANQSEYNKFMSVNVTASQIALTKDAAASGACIVYPYIMTQGSLPSIEWQNAPSVVKSNIFIAPSDTLEDYTTVGLFSDALIQYNPALREGDQLSFIRLTQMVNATTGYPYVIVRKYEMILSKTSAEALEDYWPVELFSAPGTEEGNVLQVKKENRQGGFLMIISRTIGGKTYVSTQGVVIVNNEAFIQQYSSASAIQAAIQSYGDAEDAFLSSTSAGTTTQAPVSLSINYAILGEENFISGNQTPKWVEIEGTSAAVIFNDNLPAAAAISGSVMMTGGQEAALDGPIATGNRVTFQVPDIVGDNDNAHVYRITITVAGTDYVITFADANSYTIQGLE